MEGISRTQSDAPLHIGGIYENGAMHASVEIPGLLSLLAYRDVHAPVAGLDTVPPANRPPVNVVHVAFDVMVGIGTLLALLGIGWFVLAARRRLPRSPWFYRAVIVAAPLSLIALLAGWTTTEVGRQPWIAWQVMRTTDAVTSAHGLPFAYASLALVYIGLTVVAVWLLRRVAREEPGRMPSVPASVEAR
jgi:cytochrome d ubiquinol oxidase subunit I